MTSPADARRTALLAVALSSLVGCGSSMGTQAGTGGNNPGNGGTTGTGGVATTGGHGGSSTGGSTTCSGPGFAATPTDWPVPGSGNTTFSYGLAAFTSCPTFGTIDMDSDGKPDLVVTEVCDATSTVGTDQWLVYRNTGSGFAATPINWPVPGAGTTTFYSGLAASSLCPTYATVDMDGDGKPDLVVTKDCVTPSTVGTDHWLVYRNTGSGFATTATNWSVPGTSQASFSYGIAAYNIGPDFATIDMDGDGRPDLVVTDDNASPPGSDGVGLDHWLVYHNTGSGFAATATNWSVPGSSQASFSYGIAAYNIGPDFATIDMDGDGKPDLVVTDDNASPPGSDGVGLDHWLVYHNTGSGFAATATSWPVPGTSQASFSYGIAAYNIGPDFATIDMDGDGKPDLVVTDDNASPPGSDGVGLDHWLVYHNTGSGFAATATSWPVPGTSQASFSYGIAAYNIGPDFATIDMDGDGRPDLVVTDDNASPPGSDGVGLDHWLVYSSRCN